ncbi:hypothetical protein [Saccharibacillus sacchari]|uniref:Uncharacterized protein n=1 Tax=Saccharibacillus sacchari TaxID=456493 RepID=A0ACC6P9R6_9BACL
MGKYPWSVLIVIVYALPFVYFGMQQDYGHQSPIGYVAMVAVMGLLAFASMKLGSVYALLIGNIASFAVSFYFVGKMQGDTLDAFFKPLSAEQTLIFVSVLMLVLQAVVAGITYWIILRKKRSMNPYRSAS